MAFSVSLRSSTDVTEAERLAWAALEARAIEPNAYLSPHFVLPALRHLDEGARAILAFVWDADALRGVGVFTTSAPNLVCPLPHLVAYRSCHSYLSGLLVDRATPAETTNALFHALASDRRWHAVLFRQVRGDGPLSSLLQSVTDARKTPWRELKRGSRAILRPREAGPAYLEGRLKARLGDERRLLRRLSELGTVRWRVHRGGDALARAIEDHLQLEEQGWKGDEHSALLSRPGHAEFFREMTAGFGAEGRALFTELAVGDEVIAVSSNFVSGTAGFAFKLGWALAYSRFSPGILNEVELLRAATEVCPELDYIDSGAAPGSFIDRLWLDRYTVLDLIVPLGQAGRFSLAVKDAVRRWRRRRPRADLPTAIVLSCAGAGEASLNVVRSLAEADVPITLVSEDANDLAAASRYVGDVIHAPRLTEDPRHLVDAVAEIVARHGGRPVLFPTADPDLLLASRSRSVLAQYCHVLAARPALLESLTDKRRFAVLAERLGLKVPRTYVPRSVAQISAVAERARYPVLVKPAQPSSWTVPSVRAVTGPVKAIAAHSAAELITLAERLAGYNFEFLVQEIVPGPDENHVDLHAFVDEDGEPLAAFVGRKLRIHPPHAGSGCFVESERVPAVLTDGIDALRRCGLVGLANMNFKQHAETGEYLLLEINPRVSQWNILATKAGVNLPLIAYQHACGLPRGDVLAQVDGIRYVNLRKDLSSFRVYRQEGTLSVADYVRSLADPGLVSQVFDRHDVGPWLRSGAQAARRLYARWSRES